MKSAILSISLLVLSYSLFAQKADSSAYFLTGFQAHYGFIISNSPVIEPFSHTYPFGFELSIGKLKTSYDSWKIFNHYNITGIQAGYYNFQNPEIVGSSFNLTLFTEPIISHGNRHIFSLKAGAGLSYQTKIYDPEINQLNKFFGTRIGFSVYLGARYKYRISEKTFFTLSGNFNHISDGAIKVPNYGMNFPTVSLGIESFPKPIPRLTDVYRAAPDNKLFYQCLIIQTFTGYKEIYDEPTLALGLHAGYSRQIRPRYGLNAGADIIFDGSVKKIIEIRGNSLDYKRVALTVGQDFLFDKFIFTQYFGFYIYAPLKAESFVYQKYELSYKVHPKLFTGIFVQAYASHAALLGLSLNYIIRIK